MSKARVNRYLEEYASNHIPSTTDIWPKLQMKIREGQLLHSRHTTSIGERVSRWLHLRRGMLSASIAILLVLISILIASPARANILAIAQQFGVVFVDTSTAVKNIDESSLGDRKTEETGELPLVGLEEAQSKAPFHIPIPTKLPSGLVLQGVRIGQGPSADGKEAGTTVVISYAVDDSTQPANSGRGTLFIQMTSGEFTGGYNFPANEGERTTVNGEPAVYVQGSWQNELWNDMSDVKTVAWTHNDIAYLIQASNLNLSRDDLAAIAQSLQ